jgi:uncharacterized membrane protein YfcA
MWEQYRKTFGSMQVFIAVVAVALYFAFGRSWTLAAGFFLMMQVGAVFGAAWAARLKRRLNPPAW